MRTCPRGDPHSPWLFGTSPGAVAKGFWHAHMGWLFDREMTNPRRYIPDLLADRTLVRVSGLFWLWTGILGLLGRVPHPGARLAGGQRERYLLQPCLLYTSPSPRDRTRSRMPSSA